MIADVSNECEKQFVLKNVQDKKQKEHKMLVDLSQQIAREKADHGRKAAGNVRNVSTSRRENVPTQS